MAAVCSDTAIGNFFRYRIVKFDRYLFYNILQTLFMKQQSCCVANLEVKITFLKILENHEIYRYFGRTLLLLTIGSEHPKFRVIRKRVVM